MNQYVEKCRDPAARSLSCVFNASVSSRITRLASLLLHQLILEDFCLSKRRNTASEILDRRQPVLRFLPCLATFIRRINDSRLNWWSSKSELRCNTMKKEKSRKANPRLIFFVLLIGSDRSGDLTGTQAACAGINSAGGAVDDRLDSLHVGLPGSVGSSVGMGNLDTELHVFSAKIAFCHLERTSFDYWTNKSAENIITDSRRNCKLFFDFFGFFSFFLRCALMKAGG